MTTIENSHPSLARLFATLLCVGFLVGCASTPEEGTPERAEFDEDKEQREQEEELTQSDENVVKLDYYFNEALAITQDYVNMLEHNKIAKTNVTATATP